MDEIRLTGHHIPEIRRYQKAYSGNWFSKLRDKAEEWVTDRIYGKGLFDAQLKWVKSMDPDNTLVEIVAGNTTDGGVNVDSLCEQDCPYYVNCSKNVTETLSRILGEKPLYFPIVLIFGLLNSDNKSLKKFGLEIGKKYPLSYILND